MDLIQGGMTLTKYVAKFIQLSRFVIYLIPNGEKKAKKFQRDLKPHIRTMMSCFDIRVFFQRMDHDSIYEESFQENATIAAEQRKKTFAPITSSGGDGPGKRMDVSSQPSRWSPQGHTLASPQYQPQQHQRNQAPALCQQCNKVH